LRLALARWFLPLRSANISGRKPRHRQALIKTQALCRGTVAIRKVSISSRELTHLSIESFPAELSLTSAFWEIYFDFLIELQCSTTQMIMMGV
jgi:hypothetical protein